MPEFKVFRPHYELKKHQEEFERHRNVFIETHNHYFHVSKLQVHHVGKGRSVGIAPWPQFLPTIAPVADYIIIPFTDGDYHHIYIGETADILSVIRHIGYTKHKEPVPHLRLPLVLEERWQRRILEATELLETTKNG